MLPDDVAAGNRQPGAYAAEGDGASHYGAFLGKFGPAVAQPSVAASMQAGHLGGSPAHLSGAATPNKEMARAVVGSIGPPNLTTCPQRPQGPSRCVRVPAPWRARGRLCLRRT